MNTDEIDATSRYRVQLETIDQQLRELEQKDLMLGRIRVGLILVAIVLWVVSIGSTGVPGAGWLGWLAFALFFVVATINEPVRDSMEELRRNRSVIERLIARLHRDWEKLATKRMTRLLDLVELPQQRRETAGDLDLFGRASLFHLVSMTATAPGTRTICDWLSGPAIGSIARERTTAIEALAPHRDERIRFYTLARRIGDSSGDPDHFVQWATGERWLEKRGWLVAWAKASAAISVIGVVLMLLALAGIGGGLLMRIGLFGLIAIMLINILITTVMLGPAHQIFSIAMANRQAVTNYIELFSAANWLPKTSDQGRLQSLRSTLYDSPTSAFEGMKSLAKVARAGSLRQSAGTYLLYLPLQAFALWDVRVLRRLEDWQAEHASYVKGWFDSLGELESLMSLAALRDDYPQWTKPIWQDDIDKAQVTSVAIGHPLLRDADRVTNDVSVGPPGTVLLVTGSNMSGKSTMLRSVGLNVALAATGAPVCAESFTLPSVELTTSIRVSDDVSQGVSFYMAELHRLKSVVDHARAMAKLNDRVCLFLLDEILQGTNSRERQIAVVRVLDHLIQSNAIGAITTHDLELADEEALMSMATTVHFRETIRPDAEGNEQMTFDYKMRQGVSPTTNALRLLEMVGLGENEG
ncbi:MutS family DNA mismatch repair protein [Rubripirellula amarantea]|uniref:MutS family DNA mismatch repair protein n=1 Tax=Rubripirellula amarantea TaxID=2527999 RepID=UPI0011B43538|nr:MutS family DNA mismatch repair protein [Rubripirellula amarantea]